MQNLNARERGSLQEEIVQQIHQFHGHMCPGLAMGIRAAEIALDQVGKHASDEEVVAVVETDMCAVDAIQFLTGCTFGKGNLIHRDYGKNAFTFIRRSDGKSLRILTKSEAWGERDPEHAQLFAKVREGQATAEEKERFQTEHAARARSILEAPVARLFDIQQVQVRVPRKARIHNSLPCEDCGEMVMETRIRKFKGRNLCIPCFEKLEAR
ncbi:MAG TPA: FmdE family protein [Pyrinomonadaceae bacterium]|nr:FmdE family protein [Pyrinomonadaceae bacterium]